MFKKLFQRSKSTALKNQIELCVSNRLYDSDAIDALLQREDIDIVEVGCNSRCEICDHNFYAIVNGELLSTQSAEDLMRKINEELALNPL